MLSKYLNTSSENVQRLHSKSETKYIINILYLEGKKDISSNSREVKVCIKLLNYEPTFCINVL